MNYNKQTLPDISSLTFEDLHDEYIRLFDNFQDLRKAHDDDAQQIYELKRNLNTATAAEAYLSQELEHLSQSQNSEAKLVHEKYQQEIEDLKLKYAESEAYSVKLEQNGEDMRKEIADLTEKIEALKLQMPVTAVSVTNDHLEREIKLEKENLELIEKIDECQDNMNKYMMGIAEREKQIEILKDQVECLDENLQSKKNELEEKTALLESTQEQMIELNSEIAMLKSVPENHDRKGNSLFAEVDDQRQAMKHLLAAQKKNYAHMKKVYTESEYEIRRLKRENIAMHTELQACANIFLNADRLYKEKLNQRIMQLIKQNEELQKKLAWTQDKLSTVASDKGINWLDSMFTFCKQETKELEAQLHSSRIQKGILDEKLRNSQQELAKWRFEALKSRCIIIDRESLLEQNKIKFKIFKQIDFKISAKEAEDSTPMIVSSVSTKHENQISKNLESTIENNNYVMPEEQAIMISIKNEDYVVPEEQAIIKSDTETVIKQEVRDEQSFKITQKHEERDESQYTNQMSDIYEDTTSNTFPLIKQEIKHEDSLCIPHKLALSKSEKFQQEEFNFEIYEDTTESIPVVSTESDVNRENKNMFEIYEDTTNVMPIIKLNTHFPSIEKVEKNPTSDEPSISVRELLCDENGVKNISAAHDIQKQLENKENTTDIENTATSVDKPSILVKSRDILCDENSAKSISFAQDVVDIHREDKPHKAYAKQTRTKSNIIIRKIIINSSAQKSNNKP